MNMRMPGYEGDGHDVRIRMQPPIRMAEMKFRPFTLPSLHRKTAAVLSAAALAAPALLAIAGPAAAAAAAAAPITLTVAKTGAQHTSVQAAVDAVPDNSPDPYTILIGRGTYEETVIIPAAKLHLTLQGATGNPADVVIDSARYNGEATPSGGTYGTEGSATVHVKASNFTAEYLTFSNSFDKTRFPAVTGTQAVAIAMEGDRQVYAHDTFYGHQDTLLTWDSSATTSLRQYVYDSTIEGDVDYIFGNGSLVADRSHIVALNDGVYQKAYLTAPATYGTAAFGILITGSTVTSTLAPNQVYLGRAWVPYAGAVPQLVIRDTSLPAQVNAANPYLGISGATWTAGRYFEYGNTGNGANPNIASRPQLTTTQAASYTAQTYLAGPDGWDPVAPAAATTVADRALRQSSAIGDTRRITEPSLPVTCATVTSMLPSPANRVFSDAQEAAAPDTARIQAALNACVNTGEAVVLAADTAGTADAAFLSGPLTIGSREFLVVGAGATLYASRQASDYQASGATCGSISTSSSGCAAFITVTGVNSGIEGIRRNDRGRGRSRGAEGRPARPRHLGQLVGSGGHREGRGTEAGQPAPHPGHRRQQPDGLRRDPDQRAEGAPVLQERRRPARLGPADQDRRHIAQHRRHRLRLLGLRHGPRLLHLRRRRLHRHAGQQRHRHAHHVQPQPVLRHARHLYRQRDHVRARIDPGRPQLDRRQG